MSTERSNFTAIDRNVAYPDSISKYLGLSVKEAEPKDPNACKVCGDIKH